MFSIRTITMLLFTESILLIWGHPNFLLSMHAWDTLFYTSENWLTKVISYGHVHNVSDSEFTVNLAMKKAQESF